MNDFIVEAAVMLLGGSLSALYGILFWRLSKMENSISKIYEKLENIEREFVSHAFCNERHNK